MQKSLGITALVLAIVSIIIPFIGPWLTIIAGALAAFAYGPGFVLGLSAIIINLVNIFMLSPTVWIAMGVSTIAASHGKSMLSVGTILFAAQAISLTLLIISNKKKTQIA
jgi:hypothetical protein